MVKNSRLLLLIFLVLLSTLFVWLPFYLKLTNFWGLNFSEGMITLWKNFDGPNYLIIAKTWYDKALIASGFSNPLPLEYYPAHWPLYPAVIAVLDIFLLGPWAMLFAGVLGVLFFYLVFYKFLINFGVKKKQAMCLGIASLILPARWIALRSVGSPEGWFMAFILLSLMAYKDKKYWLAGLWGGLAQLTKSPAILLFASFGVFEGINILRNKKYLLSGLSNWLKTATIPLAILLVFGFYSLRVGDFWAYLNSGDNFHLLWPPFSLFGESGAWVGDFWLEEIIWLWLLYGVGTIRLWIKKKNMLASFASVFFVSTLFVSHRDIARYIIPVFPLMFLSYREVLVKREVKWALGIIAIPSFLFALNFILNNMAPVADWAAYL
jgi:hypothetical protein